MNEESYEDDNVVESTYAGSEPDETKQSIVEELYNCEKRVVKLMDSLRGNRSQDALVGRRFLNKQYAALSGVINTTNAFTKKLGEDCRAILYRAVKAFVIDMLNDPTIKRQHYRTLTFTYWHTVELFLGLPQNGHGANVLRDALAGLNTPEEKEEKKFGLIDEVKNRL